MMINSSTFNSALVTYLVEGFFDVKMEEIKVFRFRLSESSDKKPVICVIDGLLFVNICCFCRVFPMASLRVSKLTFLKALMCFSTASLVDGRSQDGGTKKLVDLDYQNFG